MNMYGHYSMWDMSFADPSLIEALSLPRAASLITADYRAEEESATATAAAAVVKRTDRKVSPPKHRHDGTSPLPLGMDWSPPPRVWEGRNSVWPHDFHTGWSYCVTMPSWTIISEPTGSPVVFYRVQIGIQTPEGITTTRGILRRFSAFLKLSSELQKEFPRKKLPQPPGKALLKLTRSETIEERRSTLENWMEKILSDIELSRSAPVAIFLELEAAARSSFYESEQTVLDASSDAKSGNPSIEFFNHSDVSTSAIAFVETEKDYNYAPGRSELETPAEGRDSYCRGCVDNRVLNHNLDSVETAVDMGLSREGDCGPVEEILPGDLKENLYQEDLKENLGLSSSGSIERCKDIVEIFHQVGEHEKDANEGLSAEQYKSSSCENNEGVKAADTSDKFATMDSLFSIDSVVVLPSDEKNKIHRILNTVGQRVATAKTDVEDLVVRLKQEVAVRHYLATKVKDLEVELETTKQSSKETLQQAILNEKERLTQMMWDIEELRMKCTEMETELKSVQEEKILIDTTNTSLVQENEMLRQDFENIMKQLEDLQKHFEDTDVKSKADLKLLVKEVKSLRNADSELKQDFDRVTTEKMELERLLEKERQIREEEKVLNFNLLHECEILRKRLEECSVDYTISAEKKLIVDSPSPSDTIDILATSDNRVGLLLAEAQLLAQDAGNAFAGRSISATEDDSRMTAREVRRTLADVLIENAKLRKQVISVIGYALYWRNESEKDGEETQQKTVLSKFLER